MKKLDKKTIFKKDIEKKAAVLVIITIFIISAINPAINRQYEELEEIEILDSDWNAFLDQNDIPGDQPLGPGESWWNTDWLYRKSITINYGEVDANLTNFPMLINFDYDDDLADDSKCQNDGDDIVFTNITGTELNHEIEYFDSDTGELVCWVNVTKLSSTEDTVIYMYYGNPSIANQENPSGVWDSNYVMVQHMDDETSSTITDSTIYSNDGTKHAVDEPIEANAKIGMGQNFDGANDYVVVSDADSLDPTEVTIEAWVYIDSYPGVYPRVISKDSASGLQYQFITHNTNQIFFRIRDGSVWYGGDFDTGALSTGTWIYTAGTYDGSILRAFREGIAQTTTFLHTGSINSGTDDLAIGAKVDDLGTYLFDGILDEIRISNIARDSNWINTSYSNQNDPNAFYTMGDEETSSNVAVSNVYPADDAIGVALQTTCHVDAMDVNGDPLTVEWFENTTGGWVLRQTNSSVVANSTVSWIFTQASDYNTEYWWRVNCSDGTYWINKTYRFTTEIESSTWWDEKWAYRKLITIDHSQVEGDLNNFPVLIDITDTDMLNNSQPDGDDFVFTDYSGNILYHEIEKIDDNTGELVAWVNVTSLSSTQDTLLYMYYGNPNCISQQNPSAVWDSHYLLVHHMVDDTTSSIDDSTANNHDGTKTGSNEPLYTVNGIINGAQDFDGSNDIVSIAHDSSLSLESTDFTISIWLRHDTSSGDQRFISKRDLSVVEGWHIERQSDGDLRCLAWQGASNNVDLIGGTVTDNTWHFVVFKRDGNSWYAFLDDTEVDSTTDSDSIVSSTQPVLFGAVASGGGESNYYNGILDEIRISDNSRSTDWLSTEYNNQLNPSNFYSIGMEEISDRPIISNEYPEDDAIDIVLQPTCSIDANDINGDTLTVEWFENTTAGWVLRQTDNSVVANSTVSWIYTQASEYSTEYWWCVNCSDGSFWTNLTFSFVTLGASEFDPFNSGWQYRKTITLNHTMVTADLTDFPVLISIPTDADLAAHAQSDGDDIIFMGSSGVSAKMSHEIEDFDSVSGRLICWVNVSDVSSTQDTFFYMYYGNPSCSNQENPTSVWDSNYVMVQHMNDATSSTLDDSTSYSNDGTKHAADQPIETNAKIGMGQNFDGSNDYVDCGNDGSLGPSEVTVEGWVNLSSYHATMDCLLQTASISDSYCYEVVDYSSQLRFYLRNSGSPYFASTSLPSLDEWHYWTGVFDGSTLKVYLDAQQGTDGASTGMNTDISYLYIGRGFANYIDAILDEVRVSNVARDSSWINASFMNQNNPSDFVNIGMEEVATDEPTISNVYPADGADFIPLQPTCHIDANDRNGDTLTVEWFENTTGGWVLRQTNSSVVANSTVYWTYDDADEYETKYWWRVNCSDGTNWTNQTFSFTTQSVSGGNVYISYPVQYVVYQRHNDTTGILFVSGTYDSGIPTAIEASFDGGDWKVVDNSPSGGAFSGSFNASTGQGDLTVRFSNAHGTTDTVTDIGVGEVFVIGGQSNAVGQGNTLNALNSSNPYLATMYRGDDIWRPANDPTDITGSGSVWVRIADYITQTQNVPVAFITTAYNGASVLEWQKGTIRYDNMFTQVSEATDGTMRVRAMFYFQGEKDARLDASPSTHGDYDAYKENLSRTASNFINDMELATTIVVGQIDHQPNGATRDSIDNIRRAQRDLWDEDDNISAGPVTHDIELTTDNLHFRTDDEMRIFADRWWASIRNSIYGVGDGRSPKFESITMVDDDTFEIRFNDSSPPIIVEDYLGTSSSEAEGWRVVDGATVLDDTDIDTEMISDYEVRLNLSTSVSSNAVVHFGSYTDGYGNPIVRDNSTYVLPAVPFSSGILLVVEEPIISSPSPSDGENNVEISPILSVQVNDPQGDSMNVSFRTNATTETWHTIGENISIFNSTIYCDNTSEMGENSMTYWWSVNATDSGSGNWTNATFRFTTSMITMFNPFANGWLYRKEITINHSLVDADLTNFPVLINIPNDAELADHTQLDGDDLLFMDDIDNANRLNHEIESYDSSTGELVCWVNITSVSSSVNTTFYMYYGNPSIGNQENPTGVWDSNYAGVWHLDEIVSGSGGIHYDSTAKNNDGTTSGGVTTDVVGIIDGADQLDGSDDHVAVPHDTSLDITGEVTASLWIRPESLPFATPYPGMISRGSETNRQYWIWGVQGTSDIGGRIGDTNAAPGGAGVTLQENTWYHVVIIGDPTSNIVMYYNGAEVSSVPYGASPTTETTTLYMGFMDTFGYFQGSIDEVRVSNVTRNSSWINTSFLNQHDPSAFYSVGIEESITDAPQISNPSPSNDAINVVLTPELSVQVEDPQGDSMNVYFRTNASTGTWHTIGENLSIFNSTVYCDNTSQMGENSMTYWWSVNATDSGSGNWTNITFSFTTAPLAPVISNPSPSDNSIDQPINPTLSITATDYQGDTMDITFRSNASGVWNDIGTNSSQPNGTYSQITTNMDSYSTTYYWSVNCTDGTHWTNETLRFTTMAFTMGNVYISYPVQYVVYQRHNDTTGTLFVSGTYEDASPTAVEANFDGGNWEVVDDSPSGGTFSGSFNASVGQGDLTVRFSNAHGTTDTVTDIGVGDVFVIGGQSNAVGQGTTLNTLNTSNPFMATVYRKDDAWRPAYDPTDTTGSGSVWVRVADYITQTQNVPVAYITTAVSGSSVLLWQKGTTNYDNMFNQVSEATDGSMRVRTMLYYQGERDARSDNFPPQLRGDYQAYKENLSNTASSFLEDMEIATMIIVGQIDNQPNGNRTTIDNIRWAQSDLWDEDDNISAGPVTHDIDMTTDNLHFRTDDEMRIFANRWWASINSCIYDVGDGRGPILDSILMLDDDTLIVKFSESSTPIIVEDYLGTSSSEPDGWRIVDGATVLDDTDIVSDVISDHEVRLNLSTSVSSDAIVYFGSYTDGYGEPIVRDNSTYVLPAQPFISGILTTIEEPVISNPSPSDEAVDVALYPVLSVQVNDSQNDSMSVYFRTNALTGEWHTIGENISIYNSTVYCDNTSEMSDYSSVYMWSINATDSGSGNWTNVTYSFTTVTNESPVISNEAPSDSSSNVPITLSSLSVLIEDQEGDTFNWTIETSPHIGSNSGTDDNNGSKTCTVLFDLNYDTTYTWYVNTTDSGSSQTTNTIYTFTTEHETSDWGYFKKITIDHTNVDADLTNFPILVHNISSDFSSHAQPDGDDFVFYDSTNTTKYNHEIEYYDSTIGELIAWVNVTELSSTTDTIIWLSYGNATCDSQENVAGTWDSNYVGVWHMDGDASNNVLDSTANSNDATAGGTPTEIDGYIGKGYDFDIDADYFTITDSSSLDCPTVTISCIWLLHSSERAALLSRDYFRGDYYWQVADSNRYHLVWDDPGTYHQEHEGYGTAPLDTWFYGTVARDNSSNTIGWYHSTPTGGLTVEGDSYDDADAPFSDETGNAYIGSEDNTPSRGLHGSIDEMRLSNIARSTSWITTEYNTIWNKDTFLTVGSEQTLLPPIDTTPPVIANVNAQPNPQYEGGYVNITCDVTDNVEVDTVMVNITYPDASTVYVTMLGGSYYYNTTYTQIGTYTYFIWANDTNGNSDTSSTYTFTIQDSTLPEIYNVVDAPDPQEVGGYVNITCDVTDNVEVDTVMVNITYPDASIVNVSMLEGSYYYNSSYSMVGMYSYFIWAEDTSDNANTSATLTFTIQDTTPPEITNVIDTPDPQEAGGYVNITCDVTDNVEVDTVMVNITYPDASIVNVSMLEGSYYYNTSYTQIGTYTYYIWANDTNDNSVISATYTFDITTVTIVYVDDDYNSGTPGWGITHFDNIQDGIDAVAAGGTVYVYNGLYYENVLVDKEVDLIGEDRYNTFIDGGGSGDVMAVSADYVNISGFTIANSGSSGDAGIDISSDYNIITGNNVSDNDYGIYLTGSSDNLIYNNIFNNTNNGYDDGSNIWNISKTLGTNIIGGSYLGGNYWSDYSGTDSDGDGLGDTPYSIPGGSNQDSYPLVSLATTLRLVPESTTVPGYTNVSYDLLLEYLQDGLSGYNITLSISNPSVASIVSIEFPSWAVLNEHSTLPSDSSWMKAIDLNNDINGDVSNVLCANITIKALNAGTTFINLTVTRLDDDNGQSIIVHVINSSLTVTYVLPPLPGHQNSPTDPDGDGLFEDLNGNGVLDFDDVVQFFQHFEWMEDNYTVDIIDFNDNGYIDFDDIVTLFEEV